MIGGTAVDRHWDCYTESVGLGIRYYGLPPRRRRSSPSCAWSWIRVILAKCSRIRPVFFICGILSLFQTDRWQEGMEGLLRRDEAGLVLAFCARLLAKKFQL